jgi:hypothetical protein
MLLAGAGCLCGLAGTVALLVLWLINRRDRVRRDDFDQP